jgi:hypothetical protein
MIAALVRNGREEVGAASGLTIGLVVMAAGVVSYFASRAIGDRASR